MLHQSNKVSPIAARSRSLTISSWLKILKLCEHPEIAAKIEVMKTEVMKYQALAESINSFMKGTIAKERTLLSYLIGGSKTMTKVAFRPLH